MKQKKRATPEQITKARDLYADDDIEIDDDALVSDDAPDSEMDGVWVAAWVWVADAEAEAVSCGWGAEHGPHPHPGLTDTTCPGLKEEA